MKFTKRIISVILVAVTVLTAAVIPAGAATATVNGVQTKINRVLEVYSDGTYFTSDGQPGSDSNILNIPSRGGLPDGKTVAACDGQGWSMTCAAFANYVYYCLFGVAYDNAKNTKVDLTTSKPSLGDYIIFRNGQHRAIYLCEDSIYYYVYDGNGDSYHNCGVHYMNKFRKSYWTITGCYHAGNYDTVASSVSCTYTTPGTASYTICSTFSGYEYNADGGTVRRTGNYIDAGFKMTAIGENVNRAVINITNCDKGVTIASVSDPTQYLTLSKDGKLVSSTEVTDASLWVFEETNGGCFIHNYGDKTVVLADVNGTLTAEKMTGNAYEMWTAEHLIHSYSEKSDYKAPTCTEEGYYKYSCACGDYYVDYNNPIPATGHIYKGSVETAATCETAGRAKFTCSLCGAFYYEEIPATEHTFTDESVEVVAPTSFTRGYTKKTCTVCGKTVRTDYTDALTSGKTVQPDGIIVSGDTVYVLPTVTEQQFDDIFFDFESMISDTMRTTGTMIDSTYDATGYTVVVLGDVDGNGKVDVSDARTALRAAVKIDTVDYYAVKAGDWDLDGILSVSDAREELRCAVRLETVETLFKKIPVA